MSCILKKMKVHTQLLHHNKSENLGLKYLSKKFTVVTTPSAWLAKTLRQSKETQNVSQQQITMPLQTTSTDE